MGLACAATAAALTFLGVIWWLGGFQNWSMISKYATVLRVVDDYYVGDADSQALEDAALDAVVSSLDRWSYYMNAQEYAAYQDYSANQYQGIGVTITKDEKTGGFLVESLTADGPAQMAGVLVGDIILAANGTDVTGGETSDLRAIIRASYGSQVALTLLGTDGTTREVSVSCEVIKSDPVSYEMLDGNIGYIVIKNFESGCAQGAIDAIEQLTAQGAAGLVFDVRNDPGGQVTELVELLDYLLPEGDLFIRVDKQGHEKIETSDSVCVELPMAVLVNADSYSAAEFFAAALREYNWAPVVGEPTTGKGRSQVTIELSDGSAVHLSRYAYLTPNRVDLSEAGGLTPDVEALLTEEQTVQLLSGRLAPADDPQVQAAVQALSE